MIAEQVIADPSDHARDHRSLADPARGKGLIAAFAAWNHLKIGAQRSFARSWKTRNSDHEVHVETAKYDNLGKHRAIVKRARAACGQIGMRILSKPARESRL